MLPDLELWLDFLTQINFFLINELVRFQCGVFSHECAPNIGAFRVPLSPESLWAHTFFYVMNVF